MLVVAYGTSHNGRLLIANDILQVGQSSLWEINPNGANSQGTELRKLPNELADPSAMTSHNGRLLIANDNVNQLFEIDPDGIHSEFTRLRILPRGLSSINAMTSHNGRLIIADSSGDAIFEINPDGSDSEGTRLRGLPGTLTVPAAMTSFNDKLFIGHVSGNTWCIDPDAGVDSEGEIVLTAGGARGMTIHNNLLYIAGGGADDKLYEADPNARTVRLRGLPSDLSINDMFLTVSFAMAIHNGRLFIPNTHDDIFEINPEGGDTQFTRSRLLPSGLRPGAGTSHNGRLLIADTAGDELWEIDPDGASRQGTKLRDLPSGLTSPQAMASHNGRLLIVDRDGDELWEIDPDGADSQGTELRNLPSGAADGVSGMASYGNNLIILDSQGGSQTTPTVWEIDPDGADSQGTELRDLPSGISSPSAMTVRIV